MRGLLCRHTFELPNTHKKSEGVKQNCLGALLSRQCRRRRVYMWFFHPSNSCPLSVNIRLQTIFFPAAAIPICSDDVFTQVAITRTHLRGIIKFTCSGAKMQLATPRATLSWWTCICERPLIFPLNSFPMSWPQHSAARRTTDSHPH